MTQSLITDTQFHAILSYAGNHHESQITGYWQSINHVLSRFDINTPKRIAAFLAQICAETIGLNTNWMTEKKPYSITEVRPTHTGPHYPTKRIKKDDGIGYFNEKYRTFTIDYKGDTNNGLGNTHPDDGYKFRGHGAIQLTGRALYEQVEAAIGRDLSVNIVQHPDAVAHNPFIALMTAGFYFQSHNCNEIADSLDPSSEKSLHETNSLISYAINGGTNGLDMRFKNYIHALDVMNVAINSFAKECEQLNDPLEALSHSHFVTYHEDMFIRKNLKARTDREEKQDQKIKNKTQQQKQIALHRRLRQRILKSVENFEHNHPATAEDKNEFSRLKLYKKRSHPLPK